MSPSPILTWEQSKKALKIALVALIVALLGFFASGFVERGRTITRLSSTVDNLTTTQARSRPVVDYLFGVNSATACRSGYEDKFFADVAAAPGPAASIEERAAFQARIAEDQRSLASIETLCPYPIPPRFNADGSLAEPPVTAPLIPPDRST